MKIINLMKSLLLFLTLQVIFIPFLKAQSTDQNYISIRTPKVSGIQDQSTLIIQSYNKAKVTTEIQYLDGLSRVLQTVQKQGSPSGSDIVQPFFYDAYGKQMLKFQPYVTVGSGTGLYKNNALVRGQGQHEFYMNPPPGISNNSSAFSLSVVENSPLSRIVQQGAPGAPWQPGSSRTDSEGRTTIVEYGLNTAVGDRAVRLYIATPDFTPGQEYVRVLGGTGYFNPGQLFLTVSKDENWMPADERAGTVEEYKDKEGKVILKRTFNRKLDNSIEVLSSYYVYDDLGNLSFVLPPGANADASSVPNQATQDNYCYQYRYDGKRRLIEKKIPGKGWEYMVHNKRDELVAVQDAVQRTKSPQEWTVTKYDALGRIILTAIYAYPGSTAASNYRGVLQGILNGESNLWESRVGTGNGYTNIAWPITTTTLSLNYYDNYDIPGLPQIAPYNLSSGYSQMTKGLITATQVNVLGTSNMLWNVNYYDNKKRIVKQINQHYKGGILNTANYDEIDNAYTFVNELLTSTRSHKLNGIEQVNSKVRYDYDHIGRKTNTWMKIGATDSIILSKNEYNEIGQLKTKLLHATGGAEFEHITLDSSDIVESGEHKMVSASSSITLAAGFEAKGGSAFHAVIMPIMAPLQTINYAYNERGWLKQINDPSIVSTSQAFGMKIMYNENPDPAKRQFNGNISGVNWQSKVPLMSGFTQEKQGYTYSYDKLNRVTLAYYNTPGKAGYFNETVSYDKMGNIATLQRTANGNVIDQLTYSYQGGNQSNRLESVMDNSANNDGQIGGITSYSYDENGNNITNNRKLLNFQYNYLNLPKTIVKTSTNETISYIYDATGRKLRKEVPGGNRDYIDGIEYDNGGQLEFIETEEGRAIRSGTSYSYEYMLKDHLGSTRAVLKQDGSVLQIPDYYAFGMEINHNQYIPSPDNRLKYNGKELQTELGLNQYDYGARFYDPVIGRWNVLDPLAELDRKSSPYAYAFNNPMTFIDPTGMKGESTHTDWLGNVVAVYEDGDLGVYTHSGQSKADIDKAHSSENTSAGGTKIGETWTSLSFADFDVFQATGEVVVAKDARIDFNSNWATDQVNGILSENPSAYAYSKRAGQSGDWDIKRTSEKDGNGLYYGSKLFGKYASARDAGNIAAGMVTQRSNFPNLIIDYGFGAYNQAGNNKVKAGMLGLLDGYIGSIYPPAGFGLLFYRGTFGEDKLSKRGIDLGKSLRKNR